MKLSQLFLVVILLACAAGLLTTHAAPVAVRHTYGRIAKTVFGALKRSLGRRFAGMKSSIGARFRRRPYSRLREVHPERSHSPVPKASVPKVADAPLF